MIVPLLMEMKSFSNILSLIKISREEFDEDQDFFSHTILLKDFDEDCFFLVYWNLVLTKDFFERGLFIVPTNSVFTLC